MENEFQYRLQKSLAASGMTAAELSEKSGVSEANISNYINGKYVAKQDKCFLLAEALNVDPGWLMTGDEPLSTEHMVPIFGSDNEKFVMLMKAMPFEDYKTFIDILRRAEQKLKDQGVKL